MYLEEEMMQHSIDGRPVPEAEFKALEYVTSRVDHLLTQQQKMSDRISALEGGDRNPLDAWSADLTQLREDYARLANEKASLQEEIKLLRSRLTMMQAGYNAIATIQARLDANQREMGEHRCSTG